MNSSTNVSSELKVHEWLAITIFLCIVGGLIILTSILKTEQPPLKIIKHSQGVEVLVKGAVIYPGIYRFPSEPSMKDVVELAQPLPDADLRRFKLDRSVKRGRVIHVPKITMITVHIKGEVMIPRTIFVPKGMKYNELVNFLSFTDEADLNFLKKNRKLKDTEIVIIPKKRV